MKKILFIAHDDLSGGSGRALYEHVQLLLKTNVFSPVVVTLSKNDLYEAFVNLGVETYSIKYDFTSVWNTFGIFLYIKRLYYRSFFNFLAYRKLEKKVNLKEISLIVSNSSVIDFGAYLYTKLRIPHVWFLREYGDDLKPLVRNVARRINDNSSKIIAVSNAVASRWIEKGIESRKAQVFYDGVPLPPPRIEPGLNDEVLKLCMCGRISKFKGQIYALKALLCLPAEIRSKVKLDIFGDGPGKIFLKKIIRDNNLDQIVSLKGFSQNLKQELYNYDVGLNLTELEGFGRTTVEYMLHGLYVIGCNSGATLEILQNGKYGSLVDYSDEKQIAMAILNVIEHYDEKKNIAKQGRVFAEANFCNEKTIKKFFELYEREISCS